MVCLVSEPDESNKEQTYDSSGSCTPDAEEPNFVLSKTSEVHVSTEKVCTSLLPLPEGVQVVHAVPAVGHLSSSSIYPACLAPYVIVTACSGNLGNFKFQYACLQYDVFLARKRNQILLKSVGKYKRLNFV